MSAPLFLVEDLVIDRGAFRLEVERLEIPAGRPTLLLGPTASGKSTLLAALARLETPWLEAPGGRPLRGRILFDPGNGGPVDLVGLSERRLNRLRIRGAGIGIVPQANGLFTGLSVTENVAWPLRRGGVGKADAEERAREALSRTGGPPADRSVARLSGGESKRLAVARALAHAPRALLMDEPFTGLDPESTAAMIALTRSLAPEVTPIVVTHRERAVRALAGRVVFLRDGRIEWAGEASEGGDRIDRFLSETLEEYA